MMSRLLFIPLILYLLLALAGLACASVAMLRLRRRRVSAQCRKPPVLSGAPPRMVCSASGRDFCLRGLVAVGLVLLLLGTLGIWSTKASVAYDPEPAVEWSDGRAPELEGVIQSNCVPFVAGGKSIGLAVGLATPTNATIMTFGRSSLSPRAQVRADTLFEIGSITKTLTGLTLARQIEQGAVRLDQPVPELLPPGVQLPAAGQGITLRHLTSHSSGFRRLPPGWSYLRGAGMLLFGSDPYEGYDLATLLANLGQASLLSQPGAEFHYSNFGMMLLGHLLATKAGLSYENFVKQQVCAPLGMTDTTITLDPGTSARVAQGYRTLLRCGRVTLALRSAPWFDSADLGGAGALRSTATDMLKYLQANMRPESSPLESALRESHKVVFKTDGRTALGMNWMRAQNRRLKQPVLWHNGATGGFRSYIGFTGDGRFGVLVLSNGTESVDGLAMAMLRQVAVAEPAR